VIDELTEVDFEIDWFSIPASLVLKSEYDDLPIDSVCYLKTSFYNNGKCLTRLCVFLIQRFASLATDDLIRLV